MKKFKNHKTLGAFDADLRIEKLIKLGDPLHRLSQGIDFELFRNLLTEKLTNMNLFFIKKIHNKENVNRVRSF